MIEHPASSQVHTMRNVRILPAFFLALVSVSALFPEHAVFAKRELVVRRNSAPSRDTVPSGQGDAIVGETTPNTSNSASASDAQPTPKPSEKKSGDGSKESQSTPTKGSITRKPSATMIPATAQMGYVTMIIPAVTAGYPLYKIGDTVTFEWNYTGLIITPAKINVVAHCSAVAADFTIARNISASQTQVEWDTGEAQKGDSVKLPLEATYTLNIYDASKTMNDNAERGHLQPFSGLQFGMYSPRPYVQNNEFVCATCDPNMANTLDKYTIRMMIAMGLMAVTSFVWFIAGIAL